jgi:predicted TIM-barrel fold metal-dependent hydrolase
MVEQLLDRYRHYRTLLTYNLGSQPSILNPYLAREVCRAMNEWQIEKWLSRDDRLYGTIVAPYGLPEEAAKEIRRLGDHPKMAGVLISVNPLNRPFGDPNYHPVYEAAQEMGLPVCFHPSSADIGLTKTNVGTPGSSLEYLSAGFVPQGMHTVSSLVVHGVFEKYPDLKVLILEYGLGWIPTLLWRLDHNYDILRAESPGLKRLPSEYIMEHFMFATQPLEEFKKRSDFISLLSTVDGLEERLCFSSDYPHISTDDADFVARAFTEEWRPKVFYENACRLFDWPLPETVEPVLAAQTA